MKDLTPIEEGVLNLRVTDVRTFLQCRRRFFFEVLEQLYPQPETPAEEAAEGVDIEYEIDEKFIVTEREAKRRDEGTMAHAVAEAYYKGELDDYFDQPGELIVAVDNLIDAKAATLTTDPDVKSWVDARRYAKAAGRGFIPWLERECHDVGTSVLAVEERITTRFPFPKAGTRFHTIQLTGQPDVIQKFWLSDHVKIGDTKHVPSLKKGGPRDSDFQLLAYALIYWRITGVMPVEGYQNRLARSLQTAKATPPFYQRVPVTITEKKLEAFEAHLKATFIDIARWISFLDRGRNPRELAYSETQLCDWMCNTTLLCDAMSSGIEGSWQETANAYYGGKYEDVFDD